MVLHTAANNVPIREGAFRECTLEHLTDGVEVVSTCVDQGSTWASSAWCHHVIVAWQLGNTQGSWEAANHETILLLTRAQIDKYVRYGANHERSVYEPHHPAHCNKPPMQPPRVPDMARPPTPAVHISMMPRRALIGLVVIAPKRPQLDMYNGQATY